MGREQMLPSALGRTSRHRTPEVAIAVVSVFALVVGLPVTVAEGGFNTFAYLGAISGLAVIGCYLAVNVSCMIAFRTGYRADFSPVRHVLLPLGGIAIFAFPLVGTFYPQPASPYDKLPFVSVGWLVVGAIVAYELKRRRPELLGRIGRVFV
jgi:amino acid transporter